jgi:hypothetical protein
MGTQGQNQRQRKRRTAEAGRYKLHDNSKTTTKPDATPLRFDEAEPAATKPKTWAALIFSA